MTFSLRCLLYGHHFVGPFAISQRCSRCDASRYQVAPLPVDRWPAESDGVSFGDAG